MKLIYRIALRLAMVLLPLMAVWAALFYFKTLDEINDETDDALDEFSDIVISVVFVLVLFTLARTAELLFFKPADDGFHLR